MHRKLSCTSTAGVYARAFVFAVRRSAPGKNETASQKLSHHSAGELRLRSEFFTPAAGHCHEIVKARFAPLSNGEWACSPSPVIYLTDNKLSGCVLWRY